MANKKNQKTDAKAAPQIIPSPVAHAAAATQIGYSAHIVKQQHSGPIPAPEILAAYERLTPGLAERIVKMAEDEAHHRRKTESEIIALQQYDQKAYRRSELFGQIFALAIGLGALVGSVVAAVHGQQIAASFIGTSGVTGLVSAFIIGRRYLAHQKEQDFQHQLQATMKLREFEQHPAAHAEK